MTGGRVMRWLIGAVGATATILLTGCPTIYAPSLTTQRADIIGVTNGGLQMRVSLTVFNHNEFDVTIDELTANLTLNGNDLGTVESEQLWTLPTQQDTEIVCDFVIPYADLPGLVIGSVLGGQIPYRVEGEASVDGYPVTVDYAYEGYVDAAMLIGTSTRAFGLPL